MSSVAAIHDRLLSPLRGLEAACVRSSPAGMDAGGTRHGGPSRSSLRTLTNPPRHTTQSWVEKCDRSVANSETPHSPRAARSMAHRSRRPQLAERPRPRADTPAAIPCTATSPTSRTRPPAATPRTPQRAARSTPQQRAPRGQASCSASPADTPACVPTISRTRGPPTTSHTQPPTATTAPAPCTTTPEQHPWPPPVRSKKPKREASISSRRLCSAASPQNPPPSRQNARPRSRRSP